MNLPDKSNDAATSPDARFQVSSEDGSARAGRLILPNGTVQTPAFMPVGTQASVKSLDPVDLEHIEAEIILANTYHLMLRPGSELIQKFGGVGKFMNWDGPILTDSGGFQVFSLAQRRTLRDEGVVFRSHIDGAEWELTPERAIRIQNQLGADISMALDVCSGYEASPEEQEHALELTHRWLPMNIGAFDRLVDRTVDIRPLLFGICQGGFDKRRRARSASFVNDSNVDGLAIGGLSVGEPKDVLAEMLEASIQPLDRDRPRYLMGVGSPEDLWNAVALGVDMFDCVLPTRVARHGGIFTLDGRINIRAARYRNADDPLDSICDCYTCREFSAAYIHHLFRAGELLAYRLATIHNLRFIMRQMQTMRTAIAANAFESEHRRFFARYSPVNESTRNEQQRMFAAAKRAGG
ncbi:MAG: tRNA guanosine(34) transglycosylase Tgt [Thermomicrobiales bacterium]